MSRVYKKIVNNCNECPNYEPGWCKVSKEKINTENIVNSKIPGWCTMARLPRSKSQNDYYWAVIVRTLANEFGYREDEMHDTIKYLFLREQPLNKPVHIKSTTELNTKESEELYEKIRTWAAMEYGVYIPEPNE